MTKPHKLRDLLRDWLDISQRFEKGMISENVFLRIHTTLAQEASHIKPTILEEARAQLLLAVLMWKEDTFPSPLPCHEAMDRMFGHVVDFLEAILENNESVRGPYEKAGHRVIFKG